MAATPGVLVQQSLQHVLPHTLLPVPPPGTHRLLLTKLAGSPGGPQVSPGRPRALLRPHAVHVLLAGLQASLCAQQDLVQVLHGG